MQQLEQSIHKYRVIGGCISTAIILFALLSLLADSKYHVFLFFLGGWMLFLSIFLHDDDIKKAMPSAKDIGGSPDAYYIVIPYYFFYGSYLFFLRGINKLKSKRGLQDDHPPKL